MIERQGHVHLLRLEIGVRRRDRELPAWERHDRLSVEREGVWTEDRADTDALRTHGTNTFGPVLDLIRSGYQDRIRIQTPIRHALHAWCPLNLERVVALARDHLSIRVGHRRLIPQRCAVDVA